MLLIASLFSLALLVLVFSPFWLGQGGPLVPSATLSDPRKVKKLQELVLQRYRFDEDAFQKGFITPIAWKKRQIFLSNRYLDLARRSDFLNFQEQSLSSGHSAQEDEKYAK